MKLFAKDRTSANKPLPVHIVVSVCIFFVGLLFFLCYNQPEYYSYGEEGDSLLYTLPAFVLLTVGPVLDVLFYFALPTGKKKVWADILAVLPAVIEAAGVVSGAVAYFRHYSETNSGIALPRFAAIAILGLTILLSAYTLFVPLLASGEEEKTESPKEKADAQEAGHATDLTVLFAYGAVVALFSLSVFLTAGYEPTSLPFILIDMTLIAFVVGAVISYFVGRNPSKAAMRDWAAIIVCSIVALLTIIGIIAVTVEFETATAKAGGITYRGFYWCLGANIVALVFALVGLLFVLYRKYPDKFAFLSIFTKPADGLEPEPPEESPAPKEETPESPKDEE